MLLSYRIENFKTFKLSESFSMRAKPLTRHKEHLINGQILPVVVFYGPNGGGKTSIIESMQILTDIVKLGNNIFQIAPFLEMAKNANRRNEEMKWEIEFVDEDITTIYKYELHISNHIIFEKFSFRKYNSQKENIVFSRSENKYCPEIKKSKLKFENTNGTYLNFIHSTINIESVNFLMKEIKKILFLNISPVIDNVYQKGWFSNYPIDIEYIKKNKDIYLQIFKDLDINIIDIEINKIIENRYDIFFIKKTDFDDSYKIHSSQESVGTRKIFFMMTEILKGMHNNAIFLIDELDVSLHTKLLGYIIKMFTKKSNKGSQLIFTSHDMGTLNKEFFRKDEIYFSALNESYFSNIICLNDFALQIRDSNSFSKIYLEGKIGFDPYIDYSMNLCIPKIPSNLIDRTTNNLFKNVQIGPNNQAHPPYFINIMKDFIKGFYLLTYDIK